MKLKQATVLIGLFLASCGGGGSSSTPSAPATTAQPPVTTTQPPTTTQQTTLTLGVDKTSANFTARRFGTIPASETFSVSWPEGGSSDINPQFTQGTTQPAWLTITKSGSTSPVTFDFTVNTTNLTAQNYSASFSFVDDNSNNVSSPSQTVDINFTVQSFGAENRASQDKILHFGEEIILNGANVAWSQNSWFNQDIGAADSAGQPLTNVAAFQNHFATIAAAGGNSARIWLHSGAVTTPVVEASGNVTGLSRDLTDAQVVGQLHDILDAAWAEGVLVTFNLLSFNMICDTYQPLAVKQMMETPAHLQSYIDNALTPLVLGVKDHPALLAWDLFNEPEGMSQVSFFCPSTYTVSTETVQQVANQAAAAIHELDPNVKVTIGTHTDLFDNYSNANLTTIPGARLGGTLDFYSLHWYDTGWLVSPHITPAVAFNADKPVTIGEYDAEDTGSSGPTGEDSLRLLLENGYAGGWPWSLATKDVNVITSAITEASALSGPLDKAAIEACIQNKPANCYTQ